MFERVEEEEDPDTEEEVEAEEVQVEEAGEDEERCSLIVLAFAAPCIKSAAAFVLDLGVPTSRHALPERQRQTTCKRH